MRNAWSDLKSFVTVTIMITLDALLITLAVKGMWDLFQIAFTLFSAIASSVVTYYFTKKDKDNKEE